MGLIQDKVLGKPASGSGTAGEGPAGQEGQQGQQSQSSSGEQSSATPPTEREPSEDVIVKFLNEKGIHVTNIDELNAKLTAPPAPPAQLTPEEQAAADERKRDEARSFALSSGYVKSEDFDLYAKITSAKPMDVVFTSFLAEEQEREKDLPENERRTEDQIRSDFEDFYHLNLTENDPRRLRGEKEIEKKAKSYINRTFSKVINVDKEYDKHLEGKTARTKYTALVDDVVGSIQRKQSFNVKESDSKLVPFDYTIPDETINAVKELFANDESFSAYGQKATKESLSQTILNAIKIMEFDRIVTEGATTYRAGASGNFQRGRRGLPELPNGPVMTPDAGGGSGKRSIVKEQLQKPENQRLLNSR